MGIPRFQRWEVQNQNGVTTGLGSGGQFATLSGISGLGADDFLLQA